MNVNEKDNLIVDGIKTLLDESPLYGNIVMNLAREKDLNLDHALALNCSLLFKFMFKAEKNMYSPDVLI